ncbi:MAG: hypothetical protein QOE66_1845 [Chloroflexota bacterium]|nr:hypothetical protein [Chloroflexota bacterium]
MPGTSDRITQEAERLRLITTSDASSADPDDQCATPLGPLARLGGRHDGVLVSPVGLEPTTERLRVSCSAAELRARRNDSAATDAAPRDVRTGLGASVAPLALATLGGRARMLALVRSRAAAGIHLVRREASARIASHVALGRTLVDRFALLGWHRSSRIRSGSRTSSPPARCHRLTRGRVCLALVCQGRGWETGGTVPGVCASVGRLPSTPITARYRPCAHGS